MKEQLLGGGYLVALSTGSLAVEGVPNAKRGLVVQSALLFLEDNNHRRGAYRLTRKVIAGTDLWHAKREVTQ